MRKISFKTEFNRQYDPYITDDPQEVPIVMKTKFTASVMILGVISSQADVMGPHFLSDGLRLELMSALRS